MCCVQVVQFYISQSQAANHAVREAACTCIAELGTKVSGGRGEVFMCMCVCVCGEGERLRAEKEVGLLVGRSDCSHH